jgi:hypothetical protein
MLVTLTVSQWTARKFDRKATKEVNASHGAKDAGRFNKLLIDAASLLPIQQTEGAARLHHYSITLPWGNLGERLLPATLFMEYADAMSKYRMEFESRVAALVSTYPKLREDARVRLGSLYEPSDYPIEIGSRFSFATHFAPVSSADDFRVNLSSDYVAVIKQDLINQQNSRQAEAMKHVWERVRDVVEKIQEVCSKEKPRIFDSMVDNARQLVDVLPALNLSNDPDLNRVADEMRALLVPTAQLRTSAVKRNTMAKTADQILASLPWPSSTSSS